MADTEKKTVDADEDKGKKAIVDDEPIADKVEGKKASEKKDTQPKVETVIDTDDDGVFIPVEKGSEAGKEPPIDNAAVLARFDTILGKIEILEANIVKSNECLTRILTLISPSSVGVPAQPIDRYSQQIDAFLGVKPL